MKRFIAILLCLLLSCSSAWAVETGVENGDFERITEFKPDAWTLYGGASHVPGTWDASSQSIVPNGDFEMSSGNYAASWTHFRYNRIVHSASVKKNGSYAVGITGTDGACIYQNVPVLPDTDYLLSAWLYAEEGASPAVSLAYYTLDGTSCGTGESIEKIPSEGEWHYASAVLHTPQNAAEVRISCAASKMENTYCYYDDVSLCVLAEENEFSFETDAIFYYTDWETGTATVTALGTAKGKTVKFTLSDGETILEQKSVNFSDNQAKYSFPLTILAEVKKEYILTAEVTAQDGTKESFSERIYRYNRPTVLTKDGVYMDGNVPFYPVIGYHVYNDDYLRLSEIGVNVVQVSSAVTKEQLDMYEALGIKALISLYTGGPAFMQPGAHPDNWAHSVEVVKKFKDHPAVFGWAAMDEPFWNTRMDSMNVWMRDTYKLIRDIDDMHPVYICQAPAQYYAEAEKYCDILACDPYSYSDDSGMVTTQTEMAVAAARGRKPVYTIVQTFSSSAWFPSSDVVRAQVHRGFASGAKGIGYYSISDASSDGQPLYTREETWNGMATFSEEELDLLFKLNTSDAYKEVSSSENSSAVYSPFWKSWKTIDGTAVYIVVHNRSKTEGNVTVPLSGIGSYTWRKVGSNGDLTGNGNFGVTLSSGEVAMYVLTPVVPLSMAVTLQSVQLSKTENHYISLPILGAGALQRVQNLTPYISYTISFSYKVSVKDALELKVDFGVNDGRGYVPWKIWCKENGIDYLEREQSYTEQFGTAETEGGTWRTMTVDFYMPSHANALNLSIEACASDPYAAIDNVKMSENKELNLLKNGSLNHLKDEKTLSGGWMAYDTYMKNGIVSLQDGYIKMQENPRGESANLRQYVYLYAGETYVLSFDFLGNQPEISVWYSTQRANTVTEWGETALAWKEYTVYFTAPETNRYYIWFGGRETKGTYCYDNMSLTPVDFEKPLVGQMAGKAVAGGCVENVCIPFFGTPTGEGEFVVLARNTGSGNMLAVGAYSRKNELILFDITKEQGLLKLYVPYTKEIEKIQTFLWNERMMPE